ncbi:hypothetical protein CIHG_10155 [Coccidioides immitis H538.4]|uniref:Uncharacterized protein n=1 Tax=Coccidioides immitis H538.4 TaxID=396776 RepID=A0A0J8S7K2_COCIT|nr:hypothetical protein CIHG_10155 [Coccidioides immitis H538.4]
MSEPLSSAALSLPPAVVIAPALARNTTFTQIPPATTFAGALQANPVVLPGLLSHTGVQALSVCKRAWCHKPIQRPVLIAGLNNSNQLTVHAQLCESILITQDEVQLSPEQKCSACKRAQQDYNNIVFAECISADLSQNSTTSIHLFCEPGLSRFLL